MARNKLWCGGYSPDLVMALRTEKANLLAALEAQGAKCWGCEGWHVYGCLHWRSRSKERRHEACSDFCERASGAVAAVKQEEE